MHSLFTKLNFLGTNHSSRSLFNFPPKSVKFITIGLLLLVCIGIRIWFWYATHLTFEDALITFRYAENVASGNGFVYNTNERVLGTTTPLWTLLLAGVKFTGADLFSASKILSILLDTVTCLLIVFIMRSFGVRIMALCAVFFATSPVIIPVTISGMETSLLLCVMSVALLGYVRKNIFFGVGLALTILTRTDGVIYAAVFVGIGILHDSKWAFRQLAITCLFCLPWYIFSLAYFGSILPQSLLAKRSVYHLDLITSAAPFINAFTPFLDIYPIKILSKSIFLLLLCTGMIILFIRKSVFLPAGIFVFLYSAVFMFSRTIIFNWYLIPPIFVSYILLAVAIDWCIIKVQRNISKRVLRNSLLPLFLFAILLMNVSLVQEKIEKYSQLQEFEKDVRQTIGVWLKDNAKPGSKIFLEPIGYIGYFAGPKLNIQDEIGLLTPKVVEFRSVDIDWYTKIIRAMKPDYIVQYTAALNNNEAEGTRTALFTSDAERTWFFSNFHPVITVKATKTYPQIAQMEKEYIIFKRSDATL